MKTWRTARESPSSRVKRWRSQSHEQPRRRSWLMILPPDSSFQSQTRRTNSSRPIRCRSVPSAASCFSTTFCVAMPGVVGPRHPERAAPLHAAPAHQDVLERVVQGVADVQDAGDVRRRDDDGERLGRSRARARGRRARPPSARARSARPPRAGRCCRMSSAPRGVVCAGDAARDGRGAGGGPAGRVSRVSVARATRSISALIIASASSGTTCHAISSIVARALPATSRSSAWRTAVSTRAATRRSISALSVAAAGAGLPARRGGRRDGAAPCAGGGVTAGGLGRARRQGRVPLIEDRRVREAAPEVVLADGGVDDRGGAAAQVHLAPEVVVGAGRGRRLGRDGAKIEVLLRERGHGGEGISTGRAGGGGGRRHDGRRRGAGAGGRGRRSRPRRAGGGGGGTGGGATTGNLGGGAAARRRRRRRCRRAGGARRRHARALPARAGRTGRKEAVVEARRAGMPRRAPAMRWPAARRRRNAGRRRRLDRQLRLGGRRRGRAGGDQLVDLPDHLLRLERLRDAALGAAGAGPLLVERLEGAAQQEERARPAARRRTSCARTAGSRRTPA